MHMADALVTPVVGATMWAAAAGMVGYSAKRVREDIDDKKIPLMGVLGAFVFAAQMINFTIPGTGSSGHLGGGMILAILLGPHAGLLVLSSVLVIQALLFADGGLLALGCNIFNLGFFPCFIAYPYIYKKIVGNTPSSSRVLTGSILSAVVGLQLGAFAVVCETVLSGISELPFSIFMLFMQPIHLAIGIVEGVVTAAVVAFVLKSQPEILARNVASEPLGSVPVRSTAIVLLVAAVITGGLVSWFASSHPDGLEWAIFKTSGTEKLASPETRVHQSAEELQAGAAILPDYGLPGSEGEHEAEATSIADAGTTISGLVGGAVTLLLVAFLGFLLKRQTVGGAK